jgi:two-component system OmpR family sensor kinase
MRIRTLYAKLALVLLALFCVMTAAYLGLTMMTARMYMDEATQRLNRTLAANLAREKPVVRDGRLDRRMLDQVFDALMAVNPSIEIYLLDAHGGIVAFSAPPGKVRRRGVALEPIRRFLAGDRLPIRGDDPRDPSRRKIFSAAQLDADHYLYVILGGESSDSAMAQLRRSYILQQSVVIAIAAVVFALAAALLIFAAMTRRVRRLAAAMESFKRSDFSGEARVPPHRADGGDEIDRLTATFDEMAQRIVLQVKKLTEVDLLRRELVANVSHDLRTPLASLQGYLDTLLLKEGQLTPAEQRRFLEIASKHSERLGKLVAELFELAKLDSQVTPIRVEPFSMAELVQDVVQKFELRARQGSVTLEAEVGPDLPLVMGDIALMERVLENLIENAIRYTPAGGRVRVSLTPEQGRLVVRVSDTGAGIEEASLPHIFDRFWRGDDAASRGSGAGLGLAIAKRILEMHGTTLNAESRVNVGTTFAFRLA